MLDQIVARDDLTRVGGEVGNQVQYLRFKRDNVATPTQFAARCVELKFIE